MIVAPVCIGKEGYNMGQAAQGSLNITEDNAAQTMRADTHPSAVAVRTANTGANGHGFADEASHTLDCGGGRPSPCISIDRYNQTTESELMHTLKTNAQTGDGGPCALVRVVDMTHADEVVREVDGDAAPTLQSRMGTGGNQVPLVAFDANLSYNPVYDDDAADTLAVCHKVGVAVGVDGFNNSVTGDTSKTLTSAASDYHHVPLAISSIVRRLTPTECERLQGFDDGWTAIPYNGRPAEECPDSGRYKALGNSWACNCSEWILRRIAHVLVGVPL